MADFTLVSNDPKPQKLVVVRGTTFHPIFTVSIVSATTGVKTPVPLSDAFIVFEVKKRRFLLDDVALLTYDSSTPAKGITILDYTKGIASLLIPANDTLNTFKFPSGKELDYALKVIIGTNPQQVVAQGPFVVVTRAVQRTS